MPQLPPGSPFEELFKDFFDKRGGEEQSAAARRSARFVHRCEGYHHQQSVIQGRGHHRHLRDDTQLKAADRLDSRIDVALLKVEPPNKKPLPPSSGGDSDKAVGDWVIAIGNPSASAFGDRRHHLGARAAR
jgi:serine protease Do